MNRIVARLAAWLMVPGASIALHGNAEATDMRRSGADDMSAATQALQRDDTQNPAMLWVRDGEAQWSKPPTGNTEGSATSKSCADCHGTLDKMRGVAARYPALSTPQRSLLTLGERINQCRTQHQAERAWARESAPLLGLEAAIAKQSRGMPITADASADAQAAQRRGATLFAQRIGQVDLSCRDCHESLAGKRLGGNTIPQGHPTAYPIYRLEWQSIGSLQRRLRNCITAVRGDVSAFTANDFRDIEAYLMKRAEGMKMESPGVRP